MTNEQNDVNSSVNCIIFFFDALMLISESNFQALVHDKFIILQLFTFLAVTVIFY